MSSATTDFCTILLSSISMLFMGQLFMGQYNMLFKYPGIHDENVNVCMALAGTVCSVSYVLNYTCTSCINLSASDL